MSAAPRYEEGTLSLLDELLKEQQSLSAVDVFARCQESNELAADAPVYEQRIPVGRTPAPGQQLAFRVDLDACTGCKACVTACHSMNGLAPDETWRTVGLLVGEGDGSGLVQTVTTTCHHCEDPACLAGCPVQAYTKDPVTGIVRHLDDQCIGCQYCLLTCLYDAPKFNSELGIVRKCDMCADRLSEGEDPACVQGCPHGAISIEIVNTLGDGRVPELLLGESGSIPDSQVTRPTTRYVSSRTSVELHAADRDCLTPAPAHDPLAVMLVLMQLSVGTLLFDALGFGSSAAQPVRLVLVAVAAAFGLGAATLHLGRPLYAFRGFLGWRTSWMSREIVAFGAYVPFTILAAAASFIDAVAFMVPALASTALALGLAGTICSMMIYVVTRRRSWAFVRTGPTFAGTLVALGALGAACSSAWFGGGVLALLVGLVVLAAKVFVEAFGTRKADSSAALTRSLRLLRGPLRRRVCARFGLAIAGLAFGACALAAANGGAPMIAALFPCAGLLFLGELLERHLYFTSESTPGMPGH